VPLVHQRLLNAEPAASDMSGNTDKADWQGRGSDKLQGEGAGQQAKGDAQQLKGDAKNAIKDCVNEVADEANKKL
jgi:uncharacterized protein YjbJ (UPF0337 family)